MHKYTDHRRVTYVNRNESKFYTYRPTFSLCDSFFIQTCSYTLFLISNTLKFFTTYLTNTIPFFRSNMPKTCLYRMSLKVRNIPYIRWITLYPLLSKDSYNVWLEQHWSVSHRPLEYKKRFLLIFKRLKHFSESPETRLFPF